jgi:hypothetical protein
VEEGRIHEDISPSVLLNVALERPTSKDSSLRNPKMARASSRNRAELFCDHLFETCALLKQ